MSRQYMARVRGRTAVAALLVLVAVLLCIAPCTVQARILRESQTLSDQPVGGMRTLLQLFQRARFGPTLTSTSRPSSYSSLLPNLGTYSIFGSSFGPGLSTAVGPGVGGNLGAGTRGVNPSG